MPEIVLEKMQRNTGVGRLEAVGVNGSTKLQTLYQQGNAKIRIPVDHQTNNLEAVMINIAGGMTGGDELSWKFKACDDAQLTLTTQACEKIYKSSGGFAENTIQLKACAGSRLNWLPQETILFDDCNMRRKIELELNDGAEALIVEPMIFGRKAMGEDVRSASIFDRWRIRQDGALVHAEDFQITGAVDDQLGRTAVAAGNRAFATALLFAPDGEGKLESVRKIVGKAGATSFWNGKLLVRLAAPDGYLLRQTLIPLINCLTGKTDLPKCWSQ